MDYFERLYFLSGQGQCTVYTFSIEGEKSLGQNLKLLSAEIDD